MLARLRAGLRGYPAGHKRPDEAVGLNKLYQNRDIVRYLQTRGERVRVSVDSQDIPYNFGDWFGVDPWLGYQPGVLQNIFYAIGNRQAQRLLSVGYHAGHAPDLDKQTEVFVGIRGGAGPDRVAQIRSRVHYSRRPVRLRGQNPNRMHRTHPRKCASVTLYAGAGLALLGLLICAGCQLAPRRREYPRA